MPATARKRPYDFLPALARQGRGGAVLRVQDAIRNAIVRLDLPPGAVIDKAALCAQLQVSRFPVSEALGRLAEEGFVVIMPQRGTRVAPIDLADCRQAMFIRRALESEAVRIVAKQVTPALLQQFDENLAEQQRAIASGNRLRFHELDLAFHALLLDTLGFERVNAAVEAARANLDRMRLFLCTPVRQASTFAEHRLIVDALRKRRPAAAARAMEAHLNTVMSELESYAKAHPEAVIIKRDQAAA